MSHGLLAVNNNNQILVSTDTRNLHFVQKLSGPTEIVEVKSTHGGIHRLRYRVTCSVTPVPFFTMPTLDFYGVTRVTSVGTGEWDIELLRSGTNTTYPEMYVFADPRASTATESHGMVVYRDDGTPSFDSRLKPLAITGGLAVTHPSNPRPTFPFSLSHAFCESPDSAAGDMFAPDAYNSYTVTGQPAKPMFFYASLAQAQRQALFYDYDEDCAGVDKLDVCIRYEYEEWWSWYWSFYRGGIARISNEIRAGWMIASFGCYYQYRKESSIIGINAGGDAAVGGRWPYSNETLNLSSSSIIIADAARYD